MLREGKKPHARSTTNPLRVAVLCSQRAPGLMDLLAAEATANIRIVGVVTSDASSSALPQTAGTSVPCLVNDIRGFYREEDAQLADLTVRPFYDLTTARLLTRLNAELVVLCGYLHVLTTPMLDAFSQRIINIHDSDLTRLDEDGRPRYRGLHATRDAIAAGEGETRSTVHIVVPEVDVGPPVLRSWPYYVHPLADDVNEWGAGGIDILKAYAYAQREWMMRSSWGHLLTTAVRMFVDEQVRVLGERAYIAGVPGPVTLERPVRPSEAPWRAAAGR
ncbi:MAG: hypothetical protein HY700_19570 [Gemmatimonadetes bacterium]|nr:hypothetical protein [Gemmatimonadota bacterium]